MEQIGRIIIFNDRFRKVILFVVFVLLLVPWFYAFTVYDSKRAIFYRNLDGFNAAVLSGVKRVEKRKLFSNVGVSGLVYTLGWLSEHLGHRCRIEKMQWDGHMFSLEMGLSTLPALRDFLTSAKRNERLASTLRSFSMGRQNVAKIEIKLR